MLPSNIKKLILRKTSQKSIDYQPGKQSPSQPQYEYTRPELLGSLSNHAVEAISSNAQRIVVCPTKPASIPWSAGYAEVVNAGKSRTSEDQAVCRQVDLGQGLTYTLFGLFDGHGGNGASMKVAMELPLIIQQHLSEMLPLILEAWDKAKRGMCNGDNLSQMSFDYEQMMSLPHEPSLEELIRGALESAFWVMDSIILNDKMEFRITGGTTCLVSLFICDRIFVANAGDSRAVLYRKSTNFEPEPLSFDFTPESDRQRLQEIAFHKPELLCDPRSGEQIFTRIQFSQPLDEANIGRPVLYRDFYMSGWGVKEATADDVRLLPLISGRGKGVRLMLTMGVARSLGDYDLIHRASLVNMKDFLTPQPEVRVYKAYSHKFSPEDVLVMATDGMWDVVTNSEVQRELVAAQGLRPGGKQQEIVHTKMAKALVELARGLKRDGFWEKTDGSLASGDDISAFVIPLHNFI